MENIPTTRRRRIRTWIPGSEPTQLKELRNALPSSPLIDLSSNDYLGLSRHPHLAYAAQQAISSEGVGAGGSRLVTGSRPIHLKLEESLANWLGREHALIFPSGFQANLAAVMALANRKTTVITDRLIHHSLLVGVRASGAKLQRYAHNNLLDLESLLKKQQKNLSRESPLVITESLFSMEGTSPPLLQMSKLCEKYGARLLVDEAHALGVMGPQGRGLCYGIDGPIAIISGTFGKAFGSGGAFLSCDKKLNDELLQHSGAFRYTTALAPPLTAAAYAALNLIQKNPQWGIQLKDKSKQWRIELTKAGWDTPAGDGPILSIIIGEDQKTLNLQSQLEESGLLCVAIRPPTVPEGTARLRVTLHKDLPEEAMKKLINTLGDR